MKQNPERIYAPRPEEAGADFSDLIACYDEKSCEIKKGKAEEVARRYEEIASTLTPEQKTLVLEEVMGEKLLSSERALAFASALPSKEKVALIKYIGKVMRPGEYDEVFFNLAAGIETDFPNEEVIELLEFFTKEAPDRYADIAIFDTIFYPVQSPKEKKKTVHDPFYRLQDFISSDEDAARLAKTLTEFGSLAAKKKADEVFRFLLEKFPVSLVPYAKEAASYDEKHKDENSILKDIYAVNHENGYKQGLIKTRFIKDVQERQERAKEAASEADVKFFSSLTSEQKKEIAEKIKQGEHFWTAKLMENLKALQGFDEDTIKEVIFKNIEQAPYSLDEKKLEVIQKMGLEGALVDACLTQNETFIFKKVYESGAIERFKPGSIKKFLKYWEEKNDLGLLLNPKLLEKYKLRSPREMLELLLREGEAEDVIYASSDFFEYAAKSKKLKLSGKYALRDEEIIEDVKAAANAAPEAILNKPEVFKKIFSSEEQYSILKQELVGNPDHTLSNIFFHFDEYGPLIQGDEKARKALEQALEEQPKTVVQHWKILKEKGVLTEDKLINFIINNPEIFLAEPRTEIIKDIFKKEKAEAAKIFDDLASRANDAGAEKLTRFISEMIEAEEPVPRIALHYIEKFKLPAKIQKEPELFLKDSYAVLRLHSLNLGIELFLGPKVSDHFEEWCAAKPENVWDSRSALIQLLGNGKFQELVAKNLLYLGKAIAQEFFYDPSSYRKRGSLSESNQKEFMENLGKKILEDDPSLHWNEEGMLNDISYGLDIDNPKKILNVKLQGTPFWSFYAKKVRNLMTVSERLKNNAIDPELLRLSRLIFKLNGSPAAEVFLKGALALQKKNAEKFLEKAGIMVILGIDKPWAKFGNIENLSGEEIAQAVDKEILDSLNSIFDLQVKESASMLLERPTALLVFAEKYKDDKETQALLREMAQAELEGRFREWKFRGQSLDELKEAGLVPSGLTSKQYELWAKDIAREHQIEVYFDLGDIKTESERIIRDALQFGHITEPGVEDIFNPTANELKLMELEGPLRELQLQYSEYQTLFKENQKRKKQGLTEFPVDLAGYEGLKQKLDDFFAARRSEIELRRGYLYLAKLINLTKEEAISGKLNVAGKAHGEVPFETIFKYLEKIFREYPEFINDIGKLHATIEKVAEVGKSAREKFTATDETDFITSMEIGAKPVSSCQHYAGGELNKSLPSNASDPNTKIFLLKSEAGTLVARSIARLLERDDGAPVLFVESIYSANPSPEVKNILIQFAKEKAKTMGVPLAVSGYKEDIKGLETEGKIKLTSRGSRHSYVYTDSGGGLIKDGKFNIIKANLLKL